MTLLLCIDPSAADPAVVARAAEVVRKGGVIIFPTETVYGLGGDGGRVDVVRRIFAVKGRAEAKPLARIVADWEDLAGVASTPETRRVAEHFWPGPLTLILPLRDGRAQGFRFPDHALTRAIVRASGVPFVATSANRSGEAEVASGDEASRLFSGRVDAILDAGELRGMASTVLDLASSPARLLREGPVSRCEIEKVLGRRLAGAARRT